MLGAVATWYTANVLFNVGMKHSHALLPDVMLLTSLQLLVAAIALIAASAAGVTHPSRWWAWRWPLACSSMLMLGGTLCTNISLITLSVSFTHVIKTLEPFFTMVILFLWGACANLPLLILPHRVLTAAKDLPTPLCPKQMGNVRRRLGH